MSASLYPSSSKCKANHEVRVAYLFSQVIQSMNQSSFTKENITFPLLTKHALSALILSTNDPIKHVLSFHQIMSLTAGGDPFLYRVFPSNLEVDALVWFHRLRPCGIAFFIRLYTEFMRNYAL